MHARRRGKAGSKRPLVTTNPKWVTLSGKEIEELAMSLHTQGLSTSLIGITLRDQYGVPNIRLATGKALVQILESHGTKLPIPEDLASLMRKAVQLQVHAQAHKKDHSNRRGLQLIEAKIRRLVDYYRREGQIAPDFQYSLKAAELQVK